MPDVITANRLTDGVVVFQTVDESWTEDFNRAAVLFDPQATAEALSARQAGRSEQCRSRSLCRCGRGA